MKGFMSTRPNLPTLKELMAAGAHFGHKRERSHPKAKGYIYGLREGIYIINLEQTQAGLEQAIKAVTEWAKQGKVLLMVGTKPQAAGIIRSEAERANLPYIVERWPGGLLTNFDTVAESLKSLATNEARLEDATVNNLTKKERRVLTDKVKRASSVLGGMRHLKTTPDAMFVIDIVAEATAVAEAKRLGIPVIGLTDTNANPEIVDIAIPANDDAKQTIALITKTLVDAILRERPQVEAVKAESTEATAASTEAVEEVATETVAKTKEA